MTRTDDRIVMYSDYVCPFCYLGRQSLDSYRERREDDLGIDWRPFDLRSGKRGPDGEIDRSVEDGKDEGYFEQVRENVARLKAEYGAEGMLALEETPEVDSFDAQVASLFVRETRPDRWEAFDEAILEALWLEGRDIGDPEVLAGIGREVGLDGRALRDAIDDEDHRERLGERFGAAERRGITGVPTFVYSDHAARGAVPPEHLARLVEGE
nr:DsbA family protein [Saliphagus sp. LR7]